MLRIWREMKLMARTLFIHTLLVYGDQSTQVPSDHATIFSSQSTTDITDPTSTSVTSTFITSTSPTSQENSDSINRYYNTGWRWNYPYNQWRPNPDPTPIFIPTQTPAQQPMRRQSFSCGQPWVFQDYQVSDHDDQGKCKNCNRIQRINMKTVDPNRILYGTRTSPGEVPWNIEIYNYHDVFKGCGATLISENKILSAAHCFIKELRETPNRHTDYIEAAFYQNSHRLHFKYKAVAGLQYRNLKDWRNSPYIQTSDIEKIAISR